MSFTISIHEKLRDLVVVLTSSRDTTTTRRDLKGGLNSCCKRCPYILQISVNFSESSSLFILSKRGFVIFYFKWVPLRIFRNSRHFFRTVLKNVSSGVIFCNWKNMTEWNIRETARALIFNCKHLRLHVQINLGRLLLLFRRSLTIQLKAVFIGLKKRVDRKSGCRFITHKHIWL